MSPRPSIFCTVPEDESPWVIKSAVGLYFFNCVSSSSKVNERLNGILYAIALIPIKKLNNW